MESQRHIHTLQVQLLAMSRSSQRALDYSVKGFQLRNLDFARQVAAANNGIEEHHRRIKDLSREAVNGGIAGASDFRLAFASLSIAAALHVTYSAALEIARTTIRRLENGGIEKCAQLTRLGQAVNASMRLCIIALFQRDAHLARLAVSSRKQAAQLGTDSQCDCWAGPQEGFERTVARELTEVAKQTHEIADALLFWLEGNNMFCVGSQNGITDPSREVPQALAGHDATLYIQRDRGPNAQQTFSC
jgi:phosphate uptake regulator